MTTARLTTANSRVVRRTLQRSDARRVVPLLVTATLLAACTSPTSSPRATPDPEPSAVVRSLGAVPIPTAPARLPTATASPGRPALLAMGEPVRVSWPDHTSALVTALGPEQQAAAPSTAAVTAAPSASTRAVITLRVLATQGHLSVATTELSSRDQTGRVVHLTSVGAPRVTASTGRQGASLEVAGRFASGAAQVTWRHHGHVLAIWTFTIELD